MAESPQRFINRELSWLDFNRRVLAEASNPSHPLLERVRFLSICASNLDEFVVVRIAGIEAARQSRLNVQTDDGMTPDKHIEAVNVSTLALVRDQQTAWMGLRPLLEREGIRILDEYDLSQAERDWLKEHFSNNILPVLTPLAVDPAHPFPFIPNGGVALALRVNLPDRPSTTNVILPMPTQLDRFVRLPDSSEIRQTRFIPLESVVECFISLLFPDCEIVDVGRFRVLRDSEIRIENKGEDQDFVRSFESAVKSRYRGAVMRMGIANTMSQETREFLSDQLDVPSGRMVVNGGMLRLTDVRQLIVDDRPDLVYPPYNPRFPERLKEHDGDCFAAIRHKDFVIHHPYESFDVVMQFLDQAARDPNVVSIRQTLYRTSRDSPVVRALIEAAETGKSVTAMVELQARFDEAANIRWARDLEKAGAQVVFGFMGLKTHAKMALVTRRESGGLRSYAHFGTGNYHPETARIYTDLSFFTCDPDLCRDAAALFNYMTGYARPRGFSKLSAAPLTLRSKIYELIDVEIAHAEAGRPACVWGKLNALVDAGIIDKLYAASRAGVNIELIVRGACCLRPAVAGLSENIRVRSLVGRFLEHSRVIAFGNGHAMPSDDAKVFISSADWMPRNLDKRIETLVPIENITVHRQVLDQIMVATLNDTRQSWELLSDGQWQRTKDLGRDFSAHEYFMNNPSLSGRGGAYAASTPPRLELYSGEDEI